MITLEELYEDFKEESLNRKARSLVEHKEAYSSNTPHHAVDFLSEPIDLNNPVKWMRTAKTVPDAAEKYRRKPKKGAFGRFAFGPNLELEVDTGKDVVLFADGSTQISFVQTDGYFETIDRYEAAIAQLGDLEAAVSSAEKKAEADAKAEEFDAEGIYDVAKGTGNKVALKNREQAIAKKRSLWAAGLSKRVKAAVQAAREHVEKQRNSALVSSGISEATARLVANGSFEYYGATLRFFPTALDLARMFDLTVSVPTEFFLAVTDNDSRQPEPDPDFGKGAVLESYKDASNTPDGRASLFDDIRDCQHSQNGDAYVKQPFPIEKRVRWQNLVSRFGAS